jgi:glucose/arabinose dehydrogenase
MFRRVVTLFAGLSLTILTGPAHPSGAQGSGPTMLHPKLAVRTVATGLITPTSLAFLGPNNMFVLEKNTGRVLRVVGGVVGPTVLDLAVNFASERGLLGVALHPDFPDTPFVYLYWTESTTGADTDVLSETPLLGNRVDRFVWDGSTLTFDRNLIHIRAIQEDGAPVPAGQGDEGQIARGNHDAGVIAFGPDGKLYILIGDVGRRGQLQNLPSGPTLTGLGPTVPDDQFGGPQPDDAHFTGVIVRLDDDGTVPSDNPFFPAGAAMGGEVGANIQKIFAYGIRNSFGMAFDPVAGNLWAEENGEDAFDELNMIEPGMNGGWVQIMGPVERIAQYKGIEHVPPPRGFPQPAAIPVGARAHRRHSGGGALEAVRAARLTLQRPRVQLEARARPRGDRVRSWSVPRGAVPRGPVRRGLGSGTPRRPALPVQPHRQSQQDRRG